MLPTQLEGTGRNPRKRRPTASQFDRNHRQDLSDSFAVINESGSTFGVVPRISVRRLDRPGITRRRLDRERHEDGLFHVKHPVGIRMEPSRTGPTPQGVSRPEPGRPPGGTLNLRGGLTNLEADGTLTVLRGGFCVPPSCFT